MSTPWLGGDLQHLTLCPRRRDSGDTFHMNAPKPSRRKGLTKITNAKSHSPYPELHVPYCRTVSGPSDTMGIRRSRPQIRKGGTS